MSDFELPGIVPWGRRFAEYQAFFKLPDCVDLRTRKVLDVGGGPASFAAEAESEGVSVCAVDPIYGRSDESIREEFDTTERQVVEGLRAQRHRFVWDWYETETRLVSFRRSALDLFLQDRQAHPLRYSEGLLPDLPFAADSFDLVLCSHLLFLYGEQLSTAFHVLALKDMLRVAPEVRVFPLINLDGTASIHLPAVLAALRAEGVVCEIESVAFEFQRGATRMLKVSRERAA